MLQLEKLVISGFKSFSDRTEVEFPAGITAVVGPNGCGKSNIGDAINWVLGEQSARTLRGRNMADVIFAGSAGRKPQGMAEVTLQFKGAEGLPQADQDRLAFTRRLFRSGESEYLINGSKARLRDIQDLMRDAHVGTKTYSKIEQGKIDQILNAKPRDRRRLIEDAAGIAGYKHKRHLTELKLEATEANLLRVTDIVTEVTRQINSVKRQAGKARRYKALREELREKDRLRFASRSRQLDARIDEVAERERVARQAEAQAAADLGRLEVELVDLRAELDGAREGMRRVAGEIHRLDIEIDREESAIRAARERIEESEQTARDADAEREALASRVAQVEQTIATERARIETGAAELARLESTAGEAAAALAEAGQRLEGERRALDDARKEQLEALHRIGELRNQVGMIEEGLERDARQRARLETERGEAHDETNRLEQDAARVADETVTAEAAQKQAEVELARVRDQIATARDERRQAHETLVQAREAERSVQTRLATLEDLSNRFAGVSDGVRWLLADGEKAGVRTHGVIADFVRASSDVEQAAERYLHGLLPTVVLEDDADVCRAASLLREQGAGRTSILAHSQPAGALAIGTRQEGVTDALPALVSDPRVRGALRQRLQLATRLNGVLQDRIGDAFLVDSLEVALELHRAHPQYDYLTPEGDIVHASGLVVVGGDERESDGLLAHNRRIDEARTELATCQVSTAAAREAQERAERNVEAGEATEAVAREAVEAARGRLLELRMQADRSREEQARTGRRREVLADELAALEEQHARAREERERLTAEVSAAEAARQRLEERLAQRTTDVDAADAAFRQRSQSAATLQAELAGRRQRQDGMAQERDRLERALAEIHERERLASERGQAARGRAAESRDLVAKTEELLARHMEEREKERRESGTLERRIHELARDVDERDGGLRGARNGLEGLREATRAAELDRTGSEADRRHLEESCVAELDTPLADVVVAVGDAADSVDAEALEREVGEIRGRIDRLGPVNMTAIDEFSELEERHSFLQTQKEDLERSMTSLRETIRKINRQSREQFSQAFEAIREHYREIYAGLFNGGRADLRMEEGEDILECGIEILAQPPGKRLSGVHLLSGGEKAMSAIALLFAVFRYQPSPFCMLDEVDAALDDVNVGRFARMLSEYAGKTQFIVVTHNKLSMESADLLYGVTMEEPGVSRVVSLQLG